MLECKGKKNPAHHHELKCYIIINKHKGTEIGLPWSPLFRHFLYSDCFWIWNFNEILIEIMWRFNFSLCDMEQYTGEGHWSSERKKSLVKYSTNRIMTLPFTLHLTAGWKLLPHRGTRKHNHQNVREKNNKTNHGSKKGVDWSHLFSKTSKFLHAISLSCVSNTSSFPFSQKDSE